MLHEGGAGRMTVARDHVDDARRKACFGHEIGEAQRRQGSLFGGFQDDRATDGERRRDLERGHQQREIPRNDQRRDADGLARNIAEHLAARHALRFQQLAAELRRPARHVAQHIDRTGDIDRARHADRFAVVDGLELGELRGMRGDQVGEFVDGALALVGRKIRPPAIIEGCPSRADSAIDVGIGCIDDARDFPAR